MSEKRRTMLNVDSTSDDNLDAARTALRQLAKRPASASAVHRVAIGTLKAVLEDCQSQSSAAEKAGREYLSRGIELAKEVRFEVATQ